MANRLTYISSDGSNLSDTQSDLSETPLAQSPGNNRTQKTSGAVESVTAKLHPRTRARDRDGVNKKRSTAEITIDIDSEPQDNSVDLVHLALASPDRNLVDVVDLVELEESAPMQPLFPGDAPTYRQSTFVNFYVQVEEEVVLIDRKIRSLRQEIGSGETRSRQRVQGHFFESRWIKSGRKLQDVDAKRRHMRRLEESKKSLREIKILLESPMQQDLNEAFLHAQGRCCNRHRLSHCASVRTSLATSRLEGRYMVLDDDALRRHGYYDLTSSKFSQNDIVFSRCGLYDAVTAGQMHDGYAGRWFTSIPFAGTAHANLPVGYMLKEDAGSSDQRTFRRCSVALVTEEDSQFVSLNVLSEFGEVLTVVDLRTEHLDQCSALCTLALVTDARTRSIYAKSSHRSGIADVELKRDHTYAVYWRNERGQPEQTMEKRATSDTSLSRVQFLPPDYLPFNEPVLSTAPPTIKAIIAETLAMHNAKKKYREPWIHVMRRFLNAPKLQMGAMKRFLKGPKMVRRLRRKLGSA